MRYLLLLLLLLLLLWQFNASACDRTETPHNLVTWVYDGTSFTPVAKITDGERCTIVHDYPGTL
jgi:hypothetical protein